MRMFFYIGLVLLALSFIAAAAENASHAMPGTVRTFILPAYDLWYTFWPKSLLIFEIKVQRYVGLWLWDPVMLTILKLPAWFILGGPGIGLLLFFRPHRGQDNSGEMAEAVESFSLYEELTEQALRENPPDEEHGPQDIMPEHPISDDETIDANYPDDFIPGSDPYADGRDSDGPEKN